MSQKGNMAFDAEQTAALATGLTGLRNSITNYFDTEIQPILNQLKSDDVIGESDSKEPLMATVAQIEQGIQVVTDKLTRMQKTVDTICETTRTSVNRNIQNTEEAYQVVAAAKKKAEDSTGKNR